MGTLKVNGAITATDHITSGNLRVANSGDIGTYLTTTGGWARGWYYTVNDTSMGGFGFYGSGSTKINSFYVGTYSSPWMSVTPAGTVTATTFSGSLSGNASTATKLKTARTISLTGSVTGSGSFDGSGNLSIATTTNHTHSYLSSDITFTPAETALTPENVRALIGNGSSIKRGSWWYAGNGHIAKGTTTKTQCPFGAIDLAGTSVFQSSNGSDQYTQLYITAPNASVSGAIVGEMLYYIDNGDNYDRIWRRVLTNANYTSYTVTKTGSGASGTWGINVTGSAGSVAWGNITSKPSTFTPSSHTHSYLVSGGTPSSSTSHANALQTFFNNNKASIPRNSLLNYYSSAMSNGSQYMGYFLSGYDSTPYGGFFVAHYNNPYYVGISYGSFVQQHILTSTNYNSYALPLSGGTMSGTIITPGNDSSVIRPSKNNCDQIGASDYLFWKMFATYGYFNYVVTTNYGTSVPTSTSLPTGTIYYKI